MDTLPAPSSHAPSVLSSVPVAKALLRAGMLVAAAMMFASSGIAAAILVPLGAWAVLAGLVASQGLLAFLLIGFFARLNAMLTAMGAPGPTAALPDPEGLEGLRAAVDGWVQRERFAETPGDAAEGALRAEWLLRALETVSELDDALATLEQNRFAGLRQAERAAVADLRDEVAAQAEVARSAVRARIPEQ